MINLCLSVCNWTLLPDDHIVYGYRALSHAVMTYCSIRSSNVTASSGLLPIRRLRYRAKTRQEPAIPRFNDSAHFDPPSLRNSVTETPSVFDAEINQSISKLINRKY